jgi:hypothetical protein
MIPNGCNERRRRRGIEANARDPSGDQTRVLRLTIMRGRSAAFSRRFLAPDLTHTSHLARLGRATAHEVRHMADIEWKTLPPLWPSPCEWADVGEFMLLVFTQDGAPIWEVRRRAAAGSLRDDLLASGGADTFEAAKSAAIFEANAIRET